MGGIGANDATSPSEAGTIITTPGAPVDGGSPPCPAEKGIPAPIPAGDNSIVCKSGTLVVQNNNTGPDRDCTQAHEGSHIQDWKNRYGEDLCKGVPDGSLPVGGAGYKEFIRQSECKAYKVGKACREKLLKTADKKDKAAVQTAIDRDKEQIRANKCD